MADESWGSCPTYTPFALFEKRDLWLDIGEVPCLDIVAPGLRAQWLTICWLDIPSHTCLHCLWSWASGLTSVSYPFSVPIWWYEEFEF